MKSTRRNQWLLAAAIAALPAMTIVSSASAQYQTNQGGHALDANMQAGSGGYNSPGPHASAVTGNQIVTGNVTNGRSFSGAVPYFDSLSFRGGLPSQGVDNFVRDSNGVPTAYAPASSPYTPRAYYSATSLASAPPPGYVRETYQGSFVGTGMIPANASVTLASPLDVLRAQNLGGTYVTGFAPGTITNDVSTLPPPGTAENSLYTATPLIGGSLFSTSQVNAATGQPTEFSTAQPQQPNPSDRFSQNPADQMNNAATGNAVPSITNKGNLPAQPGPNTNGATSANPSGNVGPTHQFLPTPLNNNLNPIQGGNFNSNENNPLGTSSSSQNPANMLNQQPLNTPQNPYGQPSAPASLTGSAFSSSLSTSQSSRQWLAVSPAQQSSQYRDLQKRLDEFESSHQLTDQEASREFALQHKNLKSHPAPGGGGEPAVPIPGGVGNGPNPGVAPVPSGGGKTPNTGHPIKPSELAGLPLHVSSLAEGVRNASLRSLLSSAEDLMRQDKFESAVEKYDAAMQLTNNNNPLILLGRANAELGAEFYARAETDLRHAVAADSSLLMGQYDLNKMMDPKRIDVVRGDLQSLVKDSKAVRPSLLLAYLDYNTGRETSAQKNLADAEKLVGNSDPVVELMRTHWTFMSPQMNSVDMNK